jgi:hypothetical protein
MIGRSQNHHQSWAVFSTGEACTKIVIHQLLPKFLEPHFSTTHTAEITTIARPRAVIWQAWIVLLESMCLLYINSCRALQLLLHATCSPSVCILIFYQAC